MLKQKTNKNGSFAALISISVLLLLVILLENLSDYIPGLPAVFLPTSQLFTVLKKGAVYSLVAVSMNLLNGFTGLFSLGQAGFMLLGAYTYAILTIPSADRESVYYLYGGSAVNFSLPELFGGGAVGLVLGVLLALVIKTFTTGARSEDLLGSYICAGIGGALMAQIAVNVGMNLRVLPVIGVTLPFYSAGGSSVLMLYICVGLVLSVYSHNTKSLFS